ncbi:unnamed protein product, partial [Polarella glacialis]
ADLPAPANLKFNFQDGEDHTVTVRVFPDRTEVRVLHKGWHASLAAARVMEVKQALRTPTTLRRREVRWSSSKACRSRTTRRARARPRWRSPWQRSPRAQSRRRTSSLPTPRSRITATSLMPS